MPSSISEPDPVRSAAGSSSTSGHFRLLPVPVAEQQSAPTRPRVPCHVSRVPCHVPRATSSPVGGVRARCLPEQYNAVRSSHGCWRLPGGMANIGGIQGNRGELTADANGWFRRRSIAPLRGAVCRLLCSGMWRNVLQRAVCKRW